MASAKDIGPIGVSFSRAATSGSASPARIVASTAAQPPPGLPWPSGKSTTQPEKNPGSHSARWATTSRATQPSHGAGSSQAPSAHARRPVG